MSRTDLQIHIYSYRISYSSVSRKKSFSLKVTMGNIPSVTEEEKDASCAARLFSLFFMTRKGCTI